MHKLTIREQIIQALEAHLAAMKVGQPVSDPYGYEVTQIERGTVEEKRVQGKKLVLGIVEGEERKTERVGYYDVLLAINLEFHVHVEKSIPNEQALNAVLGNLERRVREDIYLGGKSLNVSLVGNTREPEFFGSHASGVLFLSVLYRHAIDNPYAVA